MNTLETTNQVVILLQSLLPLLKRFLSMAQGAWRMLVAPGTSYDNDYLDLTLDLTDATGRKALIRRKQKVVFQTNEAGVIRNTVWGDGEQLRRLSVEGVQRLGSRIEGSREVLLLAMNRSAKKGSSHQIESREAVADAFLGDHEFFEAAVERPTRSLRLKVLFPKGRPPTAVYLDSGSQRVRDSLPVRLGKDGRASISWSQDRPVLDTVYSLRWAW